MTISPLEARRYLQGADYPVAAAELAHVAQGNEAPGEVIEELLRLGDEQFEDPTDVMHALGGELLDYEESFDDELL